MHNPSENDFDLADETSKPEILFRAFTVSVNDLNLDLFRKPLVTGSGADAESSKMKDGNELGVYMTTNETVANTAYAHSTDSLECPKYNSGRGITKLIELPRCGITFEIDPKDLAIRRPEITPQLIGHYNNGFVGDEWIADKIPASAYIVKRLTLSTHPTDSSRLVRDIEDLDDLEVAIGEIKDLYAQKLATAEDFVEFLLGLDESTRLNEFLVRKLWGQRLKGKSDSQTNDIA